MIQLFKLLPLILLAFYPAPCHAAKIDFRLSKMHALFVFAQTAAGEPHRSKTLREFFDKSSLNSPEVNAILKDFKDAYSSLGGGFNFDGLPKDRKSGSNGESLFLIQSVFAKDIKDLETRTIGLMPMAEHIKIISALRRLLPYYEKVIWNPSLKKFQARKDQLLQAAGRAKMETLFDSASHFYHSQWPSDRSFAISLYPIPGKKGHTAAEQVESIESVGVLTEGTDMNGQFGVIFHELSHSLFEAQPPSFQNELDHWFKSGPTPHSLIAYEFINEALATALGNGLAAERASGRPDTGSWYTYKYINDFAKALYPTVISYIQNHRQIDQEFVKESIALFRSKFPDAALDTDRLLTQTVMLIDSDRFSTQSIKEAISQRFRVNSRNVFNQIDIPDGLTEIKKSSDTAVVIVSYDHIHQLKALPSEWKAVAEARKGSFDHAKATILWSELPNGRSLLVILANETSQVVDTFEFIKKLGRIDPSKTIQNP